MTTYRSLFPAAIVLIERREPCHRAQSTIVRGIQALTSAALEAATAISAVLPLAY